MSRLSEEIRNDPLGIGYAGMTEQQIADSLNARNRTRDRTTMSAGEIFETIVPAEFAALNQAEQERVDRVLGLGADIIVGPGNQHNAVQELLAVFTAQSQTIQALAARRAEAISRAQELALGDVKPGHVQEAKRNG
jgi:hypothetical protein